jgi:hypothetical protein
MSIIYSSVIPENNKASYGEFDTVDFVLTFENQSLQLGSLRLEGDLAVRQNAQDLNEVANVNKVIKFDKFVGAHGVIESVQTEMLNEVFENLTEYPRLVKHYGVGRTGTADMYDASQLCELRVPYDAMTTAIVAGEQPPTNLAGAKRINNDPDFSLKPDMLLNTSSDLLPYNRSGPIRLSFNLARVQSFLYGLDADADTSYSLKDLRLVYRTVPMMDNKDPIVLRRRINIKQSIQSSLANIQVKVPSDRVEAFSASFQIQSQENTYRYNNVSLEKLPNLKQLQFLFNDQTNASITYLIKNNDEVIDKFVSALGSDGHNACTVANMVNNDGYGVGLRMDGGTIDLTNQKFSVQIDSDVSNNQPLIISMFFHTLLEI